MTPRSQATRIVTGLALILSASAAPAAEYDLIVRGGMVYDGTGSKPRLADVGIRGDKIAAIGDLSKATADRTLDAKGLAVAPGFINMLSWSVGMKHVLVNGRPVLQDGEHTGAMPGRALHGPGRETAKAGALPDSHGDYPGRVRAAGLALAGYLR